MLIDDAQSEAENKIDPENSRSFQSDALQIRSRRQVGERKQKRSSKAG